MFLLLVPASSAVADSITTYEAAKYTGSVMKVCGYCAGGMQEKREKGAPLYLYFEYMHSRAVFRAKIWEYDLAKFTEPPIKAYGQKAVCVTGRIESADTGSPFIAVSEPGQFELMKPYTVDTEEQYSLKESAAYHKKMFRPKDRVALKLILKALGYAIEKTDDSWEMDAYRAVTAFEKDNKLVVDGMIKRSDLFAMEKAVTGSAALSYAEKRKNFEIIQKLLKRSL